MKTKCQNIKFILKASIVLTLLLNTNLSFGKFFEDEKSELVKAWEGLFGAPEFVRINIKVLEKSCDKSYE